MRVLRLASVFEPRHGRGTERDGRSTPSPGDAAGFALALDALPADAPRRRAMGEAAKARARGYDWDGLAGRVLTLYRYAVAPSSASITRCTSAASVPAPGSTSTSGFSGAS